MGEQSARVGLRWLVRLGAPVAVSLLLASCAGGDRIRNSHYSPKVVADGEPVPKGGGTYKVGNPYTVNGRTYYPGEPSGYRSEGVASWYGADFHGRRTANGEVYDMNGISAAHPTMPIPSYARVTNLENGRSMIVRVNDRGPYARNRVIDLSIGAAKALGTHGRGLARVRVEYAGPASLDGSDDTALLASLRHGTPARVPSNVRVASARASSRTDRRNAEMPLPPEGPNGLGENRSLVRAAPPEARPAPASKAPVSVSPGYVSVGQSTAAPSEGPGSLGLMSGRGLY